jgi:phosphoglucosamine mutase
MAIDEHGELIDGDVLIAILAGDLADRDLLRDRAIVVSNWSNLGLYKAMAERGIEVVQSEVGDKYILELLNERRLSLGGEQSGHIILRDRTTTGDGMLVAAELLSIVSRSEKPISRLAAEAMVRVPQVASAVRVTTDPKRIVESLEVVLSVEQAKLGDAGRAVLRPSGTEPVVRVMAEAPTVAMAEAVVGRLADEVRSCDEKLSAESA